MSEEQQGAWVTGTTAAQAERTGLRYLLLLLGTMVVIYLLPIFIERTPLRRYVASDWTTYLDSSFDTSAKSADVVILGDSSAMFGVDTPELSRELSLNVLNLPATRGSLPESGATSLRTYLQTHQPPKLVVLYVQPWSLNGLNEADTQTFEGTEQVVRHESFGQVKSFALNKPNLLLLFPLQFYAVGRWYARWEFPASKIRPIEQGYVIYGGSSVGLPSTCVLPKRLMAPRSGEDLKQLLAELPAGTKGIIYLAPLPDCAGAAQVATYQYPGLDVSPPAILPTTYFGDDQGYAHMIVPHQEITTDLLRARIREALR